MTKRLALSKMSEKTDWIIKGKWEVNSGSTRPKNPTATPAKMMTIAKANPKGSGGGLIFIAYAALSVLRCS
jgi:hypothetical protein